MANKALGLSTKLWFTIAVIGQLIFVYYIAVLYGGAALVNNLDAWNTLMPHGYTEGKTLSNTVIGIHLFLAIVITLGGPAQIITGVQRRFPTFHRWNGRVYALTAIIICLSGLSINLIHGPLASRVDAMLTIFNGFLIVLFTYFTYKNAIARQLTRHRKWALRLFMVASGVWFFRIGLMFWLLVNGGPKGFDPETFTGPALTIINTAQFVIPLLLLEAYFRVQESTSTFAKWTFSVLLILISIGTAVGIFAATMILWWPYF